jgi:hypothetical protein
VDFDKLIDREAAVLKKLHEDIRYHFAHAQRDNQHGRLWREACARFHSHVSPLDDWTSAALSGQIEHDPETQHFVLTFLEHDPVYFRSGYLKEALLRHLKRAKLSKAARARVDEILLDAVRRRGRREFRRYCRLAAALGSEALQVEVDALSNATDRAVASRAVMMLRYMDWHEEREA